MAFDFPQSIDLAQLPTPAMDETPDDIELIEGDLRSLITVYRAA